MDRLTNNKMINLINEHNDNTDYLFVDRIDGKFVLCYTTAEVLKETAKAIEENDNVRPSSVGFQSITATSFLFDQTYILYNRYCRNAQRRFTEELKQLNENAKYFTYLWFDTSASVMYLEKVRVTTSNVHAIASIINNDYIVYGSVEEAECVYKSNNFIKFMDFGDVYFHSKLNNKAVVFNFPELFDDFVRNPGIKGMKDVSTYVQDVEVLLKATEQMLSYIDDVTQEPEDLTSRDVQTIMSDYGVSF